MPLEPAANRTEKDVLDELSPEARILLKRVLEIELSRIHVKDADVVGDIVTAVKGVVT